MNRILDSQAADIVKRILYEFNSLVCYFQNLSDRRILEEKMTIGQQRFGQPCIIELVLLFASYEEITAVLIDTWSLQQVYIDLRRKSSYKPQMKIQTMMESKKAILLFFACTNRIACKLRPRQFVCYGTSHSYSACILIPEGAKENKFQWIRGFSLVAISTIIP